MKVFNSMRELKDFVDRNLPNATEDVKNYMVWKIRFSPQFVGGVYDDSAGHWDEWLAEAEEKMAWRS